MAEERADRLYKRKRLKNPNDPNQYIDIPVIYTAMFKTMAEQAQERILHIKNGTDGGTRQVRIQTIINPADDDMIIKVERIQSLITKTVQEQAQDHRWYIKNTEPPPATAPDGELLDDPSHERKHFVRYTGTHVVNGVPQDSHNIWCDVELIDVLKIKCMAEQAQEYLLYTKWPDPAQQETVSDPQDPFQPLTIAICNPELELIEGPQQDAEGNEIDPPYRLDPFQNIVNIHWNPIETLQPLALVFIIPGSSGAGDSFANYAWPGITVNPTPPPPGFTGTFLSDISAHVGCTTSFQFPVSPTPIVGGLPGTSTGPNSSVLQFFHLSNPQSGGLWPESASGLPFESSSAGGSSINIVFEYGVFNSGNVQRWEFTDVGGLQRFTGAILPAPTEMETTTVNCGAFTFTCDGTPFGQTGDLTFHTYKVTEERSLGPAPSKYYIAHMDSELGHPTG